ncbi:hypothetical protein [Paenibacillus elgii]|uniref:hypothetical protein n=1 Tax=Paenibacillus elgii TaxID=189691 RepID=UPI0030D761D1
MEPDLFGSQETIKLLELHPGQYINYNGEVITKEQAVKIIASGARPVLYTVLSRSLSSVEVPFASPKILHPAGMMVKMMPVHLMMMVRIVVPMERIEAV